MTLLDAASWTFVNDTGPGNDGTVFDAAKMAALKASIEARIHSTTNPTLDPNAITDEVKTARGASANLDARLDAIDATITALNVGLKRTRLDVNFTDITRQGVTEQNFHVSTIPANTLNANGASLHIRSGVVHDAGTGTRTIKLYIGTQSFTLAAGSTANQEHSYLVTLIRSGSATMVGVADAHHHAAVSGVVIVTLASLDYAVDNVVKFTIQGAGAGDGATQKFWLVEFEG